MQSGFITIKQLYHNRRGFTLMETVVALMLFFVVLAMANTFFVLGIQNYVRQRDQAEVLENLRIGINRLSRELRHATGIMKYDPKGGGQISFVNSNGDTITYQVNPSSDGESACQMNRSIHGAGHNPVARYVHRLQVEQSTHDSGGKTVTVTLTGAKNKSGLMTVCTTVTIRN